MRRRLVLRRGSFPVEQQHHARSESEREAPASEAERLKAKHVLVEPLHLLLLVGRVVQNGFKHAGEAQTFGHQANVPVTTPRRPRTWSGLQAPCRSSAQLRQPRAWVKGRLLACPRLGESHKTRALFRTGRFRVCAVFLQTPGAVRLRLARRRDPRCT